MKGRLSGLLFLLLWLSCEYPVPSLQKITELSFSLPAIRGSSASNVPSSLSNPAFSYFQGLPVRSAFRDDWLLEQAAAKIPAIATIMTHFEIIRSSFSVRRYRN